MIRTKLLHLSTIVLVVSILLGACGSVKESNPPTETLVPTMTNPAPTETPARTNTPIAPTISPVPVTPSPVVQAISTQDQAHYISETYPDGSNVAPGTAFQKSWELQNSGTTTWTTDYRLVFVSSSSPNVNFGSPDIVSLSKVVDPGETISISVPLTAPQTPGQYKVTWRLLNPQGQAVSVDGYDLWALINVGNAQASPSTAGASGGTVLQSVTASGIRVDLIGVTYGAQSVSIKYCITLPDNTNWFPDDLSISVNGQTTTSIGWGLAGPKQDPATFAAYRCYITTIDSTIQTGESFSFSIGLVGKDGNQVGDCSRAQQELASQYPDLKFTCGAINGGVGAPGVFYTLNQRPKGWSDEKVDRIIMDAIQQNIYGPWAFTITR